MCFEGERESVPEYLVWECTRAACGFRFPAEADSFEEAACPRCGAPARKVARYPAPSRKSIAPPAATLRLEALLDNGRSAWNVGSIFRIADGAGVEHLYLCGITPPGDHPRVPKTALGAEKTIGWSSHPNAVRTAEALIGRGYILWALETTPQAVPLFDILPLQATQRLVLVVGNERAGVDPGLLSLCARHVCLPMRGSKESLNVSSAFGIAAYALRYATNFHE